MKKQVPIKAQCHVEYNCNASTQQSDDKPVRYDDPRTNDFPLKTPFSFSCTIMNWTSTISCMQSARLIKFQQPEAKIYAGSVHDRAGVQCNQCHMPKQKGRVGKLLSNHGVVKPKLNVKASCLGCHPKATAEWKLYQIESIANYTKGKMHKAEYWLGHLIDTYAAAQRAGIALTVLAQAREKREETHALWEYWTAEN